LTTIEKRNEMDLFLLIAPNLLAIELTIIIGCLATEWLDVLKDWAIEAIERDCREEVIRSTAWTTIVQFEVER
jgi:hypothetical protein